MFAGRESELQELTAFAREALAGKAGVLFISGEAGMGKTTLVMELLRRLAGEYPTLVTLSKKCTLEGASYLPFRGILEELVERRGEVNVSGEIGRKSDKVKDTVLSVIKDVGTDVLSVFLPQTVAGITEKGVLSVFGQLFSKRQKDLGGLVAPKDLEQIQVFGWYTRVMKNIADKFPLALFIDDLHWADTSSLNLLLHLGRELEGSRILVIGTYRSHDVAPNALLTQITAKLGRYGAKIFSLDVAQEQPSAQQRAAQFVRDYLASRYQTNFSDRFERLLVDRTEGNALFLTELLKNMEEKGEIVQDGGAWRLTAQIAGLADLPERVEQTIKERVDRVAQFSKTLAEILECASVEGDDFIAQVIAKVKERDDMQLLEELTAQLMTAHQLIYERGGKSLANGSRIHEFAFKHNLIREYVYQHLPKTKRELLHVKIGDCLERLYAPNADEIAAQLAVHFYHGYVPEKAVSYGLKAAQDANARYGAAEAVRFAKMGLEALEERAKTLPPNEYAETKVRLLLELAEAEENGGDPQEQKDHIQAGIDLLEQNIFLLQNLSENIQAAVYVRLGSLCQAKRYGDYLEKAKDYIQKASSIYKTQKNNRGIAWLLSLEAVLSPYFERDKSDIYERCLINAKQLQDIRLEIFSLNGLVWEKSKDNLPYAKECAQRALALCDSFDLAEANDLKIGCFRSMAKVNRDDLKHKTETKYIANALELAKRIGDIEGESRLLGELGYAYGMFITKQSESQQRSEECIAKRKRIGCSIDIWLSNLGMLFLSHGKWGQSEKCFQEAITCSSSVSQIVHSGNLGKLYLLLGKYSHVEKSLLEVSKSSPYVFMVGWSDVALYHALVGNNSYAEHYLQKAQQFFEKEQRPRLKWKVLYEIAEVQRGLKLLEVSKTACQQSLEWFLTNAEDPEDLVVVAEARLIMGKILVDMEEYQEALVYLDKAKAAFDICRHYALGETLLYLGKAHVGLGGVIFRRQGKDYVMAALKEFERLELRHKASEAREILHQLT